MGQRDVRPLLFLLALLLVQFAPILFTGRTYFLSDLAYYNHPWRELPAEQLQRGMLPLWDPYAYMGMPLLGIFQTGTFAPGNLFFLFFPFVIGYKLHLLFHHALAAFFAYLWTRRYGGRAGAAAAAAAFSLGGFLVVRAGLVIMTETLAWWPCFFLFARRPALLALAMAASLFGGYPQMWAAMVLGAAALPWLWGRRGAAKPYAAGALLALALSACCWLPGLETVLHSNRAGGIPLEERMIASIPPAELAAGISPAFIRDTDFSGAKIPLWLGFYIGFAAAALAALGLLRMHRRCAAWILLFAAGAALLVLGGTTLASRWLWETLPPLRFLRFPGNFAFLFLCAVLPPIARGAGRGPRAALACLAVGLELLVYGAGSQPTAPDGYFTDGGPLVSWLDRTLQGHRYALSPVAARLLQGQGADAQARYSDVKHRLYASTNLPYHLQAATGVGEAMLPGASYAVMNYLFTRPDAARALRVLPWADVKLLFTKVPRPELGPPLRSPLWPAYETAGAVRGRWVPDAAAGPLAGGFENAPSITGWAPLEYRRVREDRVRVEGIAPGPGWAFIADPLFPGWEAFCDGKRAALLPALGAFERVRVKAGAFRLDLAYHPGSFSCGAALSCLALACLLATAGARLRAL